MSFLYARTVDVMAQAVCLVRLSDENSYNYQRMILKLSRHVTYDTLLCVKAGIFCLSFPNRVMPLFQIFAYAYIQQIWAYNAPVGGALV